jgi:uncharacterized protein YeaO (DUF488 family)
MAPLGHITVGHSFVVTPRRPSASGRAAGDAANLLHMPLRTKRWCDPREPADGFRLLVCRYRPRALPKRDETWDAWCPDLGPSRALHAAFYGKNGPPIAWGEYRRRYLAEVATQGDRIDELAQRVADGETMTLLCSAACVDPGRCHRSLLAALIERRALRSSRAPSRE